MIFDWFKFWSEISPDKVACQTCENNQTYSYGAIHETASKLAYYFQKELGLKKGDRICILAENCIEYIYLFSAAQKIGIVLVPLNYRLKKAEINALVHDAQVSLILYESIFQELITDCKQNHKTLNINQLTSNIYNQPQNYSDENLEETDPIFILYTSGSTGIPKGALYTHKMLFWNSVNTAVSLHISSSTITLNVMPPFHTGGWNVFLTPVLHHGGKILLMKKFSAAEVLVALNKYECNQFMAVPTMLKMMSEEDCYKKIELPSLKYIVVGGEAMPLNLIKKFDQKGISIRQGFGMTEVGPNLTSLHEKYVMEKMGSIGKPNMYIKVKLLDANGKEVQQGDRGELCFAGACVTPGYWNKKEATQKAIKNGWFHSGDIATMDEDGFLYIVDRIKNMYISGGENVYPAEVEKILLNHPSVSEAVIVGVPDEKWGEVGKAFIVLKNKNQEVDDLKNFCSQSLSKYKIPKHFVFIDEIPKLSNGKIDRKYFKNI